MILCDIDSEDATYRKDFLRDEVLSDDLFHPKTEKSNIGPLLVVGNPPFGKNSSLGIAFFNQAAKYADVIAFILPKTFRKASILNKLDNNFHLLKETDISDDAFLFMNDSYNVPSVFQIWRHRDFKSVNWPLDKVGVRAKITKVNKTPDFSFVTSDEAPDIAIRRVGVNAGRIFENDPSSKSEQSHLFLRFTNRDPEHKNKVLSKLKALNLENADCKYNTAGCPSISKSELCLLYLK